MDTQRIARLTPLADVLARIDALAAPVAPRQHAPAPGRVLATDAVAAAAVPAVARALRDGFAVAADALSDASAYVPVPLASSRRVDTGEAMPTGADAVAPLDAVAGRDGQFFAIAPVAPGDGVLAAGADLAAGAVLRRAGERLRLSDVAVLAAAGIGEIWVREPRIRLVSARAGRDAVVDAALSFVHMALACGNAAVERGNGLANTAFDAANADALIVVGGSGAGRNDASVRTLAARGRVEAHGIAVSPGDTAAFGAVGHMPVLLLPGRLDAAIAVWLTLGRGLIARLTASAGDDAANTAVLARKHASPLGMAEVVPVRVHDGKAWPIASGYWPLHAILLADGWFLVPPESEGYPDGAAVVIKPWA